MSTYLLFILYILYNVSFHNLIIIIDQGLQKDTIYIFRFSKLNVNKPTIAIKHK